jgi:hypothetical protein
LREARVKVLGHALCLAVVAGCGGSAATGVAPPPLSATVRLASFDTLASRLEDLEFTETLPPGGSATYQGYLGATASLPGGDAVFILADASLEARFADGEMSGAFTNLIGSRGARVPGSVAVTNGIIGPSGIDALVAGSFTYGGTGYAVSGTLSGAFLGASAGAMVGVVDAGLTGPGGTGSFTGDVWAAR